MPKLSQKGIAHILLLIILLLGIIAIVYGVQYARTVLKPKAYDLPLLTLTNDKGIPLPDKVTDPKIHLLIKLPSGWQLPSENPSNVSNSYQFSMNPGGGSPVPSANPDSTPSPNSKSYLEAIPSCSVKDEFLSSPHMDLTIKSVVAPQNEAGLLYSVEDVSNLQHTFFSNNNTEENTQYTFHDEVRSSKKEYDSLKLISDGRTYLVNVMSAPYDKDNVLEPRYQIDQADFSITCNENGVEVSSHPKPSLEAPTLEKIVISNVKPRVLINDAEPEKIIDSIEITSNFADWLNKPIAWRLPELKIEDNGKRRVKVAFWNKDRQAITYLSDIQLNQTLPSLNDEINVEVYVSDEYEDPQKIIDWTKDTIDNYINSKLTTFQVNRKLKFTKSQVISDLDLGCQASNKYETLSNTIRVFIPKKTTNYAFAQTDRNLVCLQLETPFEDNPATQINEREVKQNVLMHEIGHLFGLPDYYVQRVYREDNEVMPINIDSDYSDIMWNDFFLNPQAAFFSDGSREMANRMTIPLPGNVSAWYYYTPVQVVFRVLDNNGLPLANAKVEVFPSVLEREFIDNQYIMKNTVPNVVAFTATTDNTGRVFLGDQEHLFHSPVGFGTGTSALLRITNGGEVRYAAITLSYLNHLYFEGMTNFATISEPFSRLIEGFDTPGKTIQSFNKLIDIPPMNQSEREAMARHVYEELKVNGLLNNP